MDFVQLDIKNHDLDKVADLIFETEAGLFGTMFGKKQKAVGKIKRLITAGQNVFGHEFIHVAVEDDHILGLSLFYKGSDIDSKLVSDKFSEALDFFSLLRIHYVEKRVLKKLLTGTIPNNVVYISNVSVDKNHRGKGVGRFLLKSIIEKSKKEQVESIILDVSKDNHIALSLYAKFGFNDIIERSSKRWKVTIIQMMKKL